MKMKKVLLYSFLLFSVCSFGQKVHYYKYGYEGIEKFAKRGDSTVVYSQKWAKAEIRIEVADTILKLYGKNKIKAGKISIVVKNAKVNGILKVDRTPNLVLLTFIYKRIEWSSGIIEEHK
jgi:hypothetical protein